MTDYPAENITQPGGTSLTERSGTAAADTVPAGSFVIFRNTGAGSHDLTLTTSNTADGLAVADQAIPLAAGAIKGTKILTQWGDANGRVALAIANATPSEVKYYILGT